MKGKLKLTQFQWFRTGVSDDRLWTSGCQKTKQLVEHLGDNRLLLKDYCSMEAVSYSSDTCDHANLVPVVTA